MTKRLTWRGERPLLEEAACALTELMEPPIEATSLVRDDDVSGPTDQAPWLLHAYTDRELTETMLTLLPATLSPPQEEELDDIDWVAHSLEGLGIVRAGPFVLFGRHDADRAANERGIKLQVEANQAFGTGHHPTTAGCLEAMTCFDEVTPSKILDIGCGSGVLAMAAHKLWPEALVVASDIDSQSVAIAQHNAHLNLAHDILFETAGGTAGELTSREAPFDLIFANILAGPLKTLAPDIKELAAPGASLILAGLLDEQQNAVVACYRALGFEVKQQFGSSRWPALVMAHMNTERPS
ncbi:MAG: 50S ribosomal protein L11 methyltransferase [Pseudomonadota bacterium]